MDGRQWTCSVIVHEPFNRQKKLDRSITYRKMYVTAVITVITVFIVITMCQMLAEYQILGAGFGVVPAWRL